MTDRPQAPHTGGSEAVGRSSGCVKAVGRFFDDFEVSRRRMVLLRFAFFTLLGIDFLWVLLPHAPRFGALDFNVSQLPFLDAYLPLPSPEVVGALYVSGGLLSFAIALGAVTQPALALLAAIYGGVYLWSQSDSYQHHYLVTLLLLLFACVPAHLFTLRGPDSTDPPQPRVASWAMRLVYVQLGLMYAWSAVTKTTETWLDGTTLQTLLSCEARERLTAFARRLDGSLEAGITFSAWAVMIGEYFAGLVFFTRRIFTVGLFIVPFFHIGVELLDFDIELFSYYMVALDVILLAPDRFIDWVFEGFSRAVQNISPRVRGLAGVWVARPVDLMTAASIAGIAAAIAAVVGHLLPLEGAVHLSVALGAVTFIALMPTAAISPFAHARAAIFALVAVVIFGTLQLISAPYDYYRQWAGFLRRHGQSERSIALYVRANHVAGSTPARHLQLAKMHAAQGEKDLALTLVLEDVRRHEAHIALLERRTRTSQGDEQDHLDLGRAQAALQGALTFQVSLRRQLGQDEGLAEIERRGQMVLDAARAAFRRNIELGGTCSAGRGELAKLTGRKDDGE